MEAVGKWALWRVSPEYPSVPAGTPRVPQTVPEELLSYVTAAYLSWCRYQGIVGVAHLMLMRG